MEYCFLEFEQCPEQTSIFSGNIVLTSVSP